MQGCYLLYESVPELGVDDAFMTAIANTIHFNALTETSGSPQTPSQEAIRPLSRKPYGLPSDRFYLLDAFKDGVIDAQCITLNALGKEAVNSEYEYSLATFNALYLKELRQDPTLIHMGEESAAPPAAPIGLAATVSDGSVSLDWVDNGEGDLNRYNVYRATTSGNYGAVPEAVVANSDYVDTNVVNGTTYHYVVTAVDHSSNQSSQSFEISATPEAYGPTITFGSNNDGDGGFLTSVATGTEVWSTAVDSVNYAFGLPATDEGHTASLLKSYAVNRTVGSAYTFEGVVDLTDGYGDDNNRIGLLLFNTTATQTEDGGGGLFLRLNADDGKDIAINNGINGTGLATSSTGVGNGDAWIGQTLRFTVDLAFTNAAGTDKIDVTFTLTDENLNTYTASAQVDAGDYPGIYFGFGTKWRQRGDGGSRDTPPVVDYKSFTFTDHTPVVNQAPAFASDPIVKEEASEDAVYDASIAVNAFDPDSDPLTFSKISGPAWLNVIPNGELSGAPRNGDVGLNSFTVAVADENGGSATATLEITVDPAPVSAGIKLANDIVTGVGSTWQTVTLPQSYNSMVVVAGVILNSASDPAAVTRIRNASGNSFELMVQNPAGAALSGQTVHYMVVEEGSYTIAEDGVKMEAVKYVSTVTDRKNSWNAEARTYANSYSAPVVVGQVMTANDPNWSVFWCSNGSSGNPPSSAALATGKHVGEDPLTNRADEMIGYIVIESGNGSMDGYDFIAGLGSDSVRGPTNGAPISYTISLANARVGIVTHAAMDGVDGGHAHLFGADPVSGTSINLVVDEDTLNDSERGHTTEQVGYIVFADAVASNGAPVFASDPVVESNANANTDYSGTIADEASDPESDPMTFSKLDGPQWLSVASNGALSGVPDNSDLGLNSFTIEVEATGGSAIASLEITVDPDTTAPNPPSLLSADADIGSVDLNWSDSSEGDFASYTVYRSETEGGGYLSITTLMNDSDYSDGSVTGNTVYYYVVTASDGSGNESGFSNEVSVQPGLVTEAPNSEVSVDGAVSGSFNDVAASDDAYETLTEINDGTNSILEHVWIFDVTGAEVVTLYLEAHHTANAEGDDFVFAYSTDDVNYTPMLTVTKTADNNTAQYYTLPSGLSGTVYVRVHDADATPGNTQLDSLYIDELVVESETSSVAPSAAAGPTPSDGASEVDVDTELSWIAGLYAASHDVNFGTNPSPSFQGNQAATSHDPGTLLHDTTYYWSVDEVNGTGTTAGPVWFFTTGSSLVPDVLHWTFDEGSGTSTLDDTGNARNGLITGAIWTTDTPDGSAHALDLASGALVEDADAGNYLNGLAAVTVSMWIKSDLNNTDNGFLLTDSPTGSDDRLGGRYGAAGWGGGGSNVIKVSISTTGGSSQLESASNVQTTAWQHVALAWSDGGAPKLYIDGVETVYSDAPVSVSGTLNNVTTLMIGKGAKDGGSGGWSGLIDDVRIYSRELTSPEILTLAQ